MGDEAATRGETFDDLQRRVRAFSEDRDWGQFHDPKSLVLALVGEVGELAELFQWIPADRAREVYSQGQRQARAGEELSDVLIYLMQLANAVGIDLVASAHAKLSAAERRFPADQVRGVAPFKA